MPRCDVAATNEKQARSCREAEWESAQVVTGELPASLSLQSNEWLSNHARPITGALSSTKQGADWEACSALLLIDDKRNGTPRMVWECSSRIHSGFENDSWIGSRTFRYNRQHQREWSPLGKPHVRFDERRLETESRDGLRHLHSAKAAGNSYSPLPATTTPVADSTKSRSLLAADRHVLTHIMVIHSSTAISRNQRRVDLQNTNASRLRVNDIADKLI